jgi:hypothetical protein
MEAKMTLKPLIIYDYDIPVIVRRRGCRLSVQITSIEEDTLGEGEETPDMPTTANYQVRI